MSARNNKISSTVWKRFLLSVVAVAGISSCTGSGTASYLRPPPIEISGSYSLDGETTFLALLPASSAASEKVVEIWNKLRVEKRDEIQNSKHVLGVAGVMNIVVGKGRRPLRWRIVLGVGIEENGRMYRVPSQSTLQAFFAIQDAAGNYLATQKSKSPADTDPFSAPVER